MEPRYELITREIDAKGKGYLSLRRCAPPELGEVLAQGREALLAAGAAELYAASADPACPLEEGSWEGFRLVHIRDILREPHFTYEYKSIGRYGILYDSAQNRERLILQGFLEKKIRACVTCDGKLGEDNELYPFLLCPMNHIGNHSCIVCRIRNSELRRCRSNLHESVNHSYMINTRPKKVKRHL